MLAALTAEGPKGLGVQFIAHMNYHHRAVIASDPGAESVLKHCRTPIAFR